MIVNRDFGIVCHLLIMDKKVAFGRFGPDEY